MSKEEFETVEEWTASFAECERDGKWFGCGMEAPEVSSFTARNVRTVSLTAEVKVCRHHPFWFDETRRGEGRVTLKWDFEVMAWAIDARARHWGFSRTDSRSLTPKQKGLLLEAVVPMLEDRHGRMTGERVAELVRERSLKDWGRNHDALQKAKAAFEDRGARIDRVRLATLTEWADLDWPEE